MPETEEEKALKRAIIERFISYGKSIVGDDWGWQKLFAKKIGILPSQVTSIIKGRVNVGPAIREKLMKIGCDIEWLITGNRMNDSSTLSVREPAASYEIDEKDKRIKELELLLKERNETIEKLLRESIPEIVELVVEKIKKRNLK